MEFFKARQPCQQRALSSARDHVPVLGRQLMALFKENNCHSLWCNKTKPSITIFSLEIILPCYQLSTMKGIWECSELCSSRIFIQKILASPLQILKQLKTESIMQKLATLTSTNTSFIFKDYFNLNKAQ